MAETIILSADFLTKFAIVFVSRLTADDVLAACYLALGKLAPDFEQIELRVGGSTIATAISEATGVTRAQLGRMHNVMGDMGDVAEKCRVKQVFPPLPAVNESPSRVGLLAIQSICVIYASHRSCKHRRLVLSYCLSLLCYHPVGLAYMQLSDLLICQGYFLRFITWHEGRGRIESRIIMGAVHAGEACGFDGGGSVQGIAHHRPHQGPGLRAEEAGANEAAHQPLQVLLQRFVHKYRRQRSSLCDLG